MEINWTTDVDGDMSASGDGWKAYIFQSEAMYSSCVYIGRDVHDFSRDTLEEARSAVETFISERDELLRLRELRAAVVAELEARTQSRNAVLRAIYREGNLANARERRVSDQDSYENAIAELRKANEITADTAEKLMSVTNVVKSALSATETR